MAIRRAFISIGVLLLVLVIGLVGYLFIANLNWLKPQISTAVEHFTGRALSIDGDFQLKALPTPTFLAEKIAFANSDWGSEPSMVEIDHLSGQVNFFSLLYGPIVVESLRLRGVKVLLERDAKRQTNLPVSLTEDEPEPLEVPGLSIPIIFADTLVEQVALTLRAPDTEDRSANIQRLRMDLPEPDLQSLDLKGRLLEQPLALQGTFGPIEALESGEPMDIAVEGSLGSLYLQTTGQLGAGAELDLHLASDDIEEMLGRFDVDLPLTGALDVTSVVVRDQDSAVVRAEASIGSFSGRGEIMLAEGAADFSATVDDPAAAGVDLGLDPFPEGDLELAGQIELDGDRVLLEAITATLGESRVEAHGEIAEGETTLDVRLNAGLASLFPTARESELTLDTQLQFSPGRLMLDPLNLALDGSELAGSLVLTTGDSPTLNGRFQSDRLDLTPFQGTEKADPEMADVAEEDENETTEADRASEKYVFVDEPLPLDLLRRADIDLEVRIDELVYGELRVLDVVSDVGLSDSLLTARLNMDGSHGGKMRNRVNVDASADEARLSAVLLARNLRLNVMSGPDVEPDAIPPMGVTIEVEALGSTPRALVSNSNGRLLVTQGPGVIQNKQVGRFSGDILAQLFSAINPFAGQEEFSNWECTVMAMQIEEGDGKITGLLTQGKKIKVLGGGRINFNDETINLEFNTQPRKGVGISADMFLTPFVTLSGTLKKPGIGLNTSGVLIQGGAAVMTGGLSFLAKAAVDRAGGAVDRCAAALEEVGDHPPLAEAEI